MKTILVEGQIIPLFIVYEIISKLVTPFNKTKAYKLGIIDERGNVLRKRKTLTTVEERNAYTIFDTLIFNIKKLIEYVPGGKTRLASFIAALFLLKESHKYNDEDDMEGFSEHFARYMKNNIEKYSLDKDLRKMCEEGEVPTNSTGPGIDMTPHKRTRVLKRNVDVNETFGKFYGSSRCS